VSCNVIVNMLVIALGPVMLAIWLLCRVMEMKGRDLWLNPRTCPPGALRREHVPALCLAAGVLCASLAGVLYAWAYLDIADRTQLQRISGRVEAVSQKRPTKAGPQLHIVVRTADRQRHLIQDDLTSAVPRLRALRVGDVVEALAQPDSLGRDVDWLWELHRGDDTLLTYEETRRVFEQHAQRLRPFAHGLAAMASVLGGVGTLLLTRAMRRRSRRATPLPALHEPARRHPRLM
jgi:hypothetical protein